MWQFADCLSYAFLFSLRNSYWELGGRPRPVAELSTNLPLGSGFVYDDLMNKKLAKTNLEIVRSFFTDEEWDAIDSALADFQDYGERETELMNSIGQKMNDLFWIKRWIGLLNKNPYWERPKPVHVVAQDRLIFARICAILRIWIIQLLLQASTLTQSLKTSCVS